MTMQKSGVGRIKTPSCSELPTPEGFSLLEMLVVLLIISVTMGLFFGVNFRQKESVVIRSFASELSMFLQAARGQAVADGRTNLCFYYPEKALITDELKGRNIQVPEGVEIVFKDKDHSERYVFASFFSDGSLILEDFFIKSQEHEYHPEADPFMGRVRFGAGE